MQHFRITQLFELSSHLRAWCVRHSRKHYGFDARPRPGASGQDRPQDLSQLNRLGDLLARAGKIGPGIALFERVARAYADDGFWAKAIAIYRKILRYDPSRSDVERQLAFLYQRSGLPITS
ncbi:MAG: hypothetical protein AAF560_03505 [Acidobacteriota bacterium]